MSRRTGRVGDLVMAELSDIFRRDLSDPRVQLASISHVDVSPDLRLAKVRISVLGNDDEARDASLEVLQKAKGFIRKQLGRRLRLKNTPELVFELDRGAEHSQRISELLEGLHHEREGT